MPLLFGNPGSTELPVVDALEGGGGPVRYVLGLHETAVMGMADGYGQARRGLAAVNVHVQPGLANALSGVVNAARARVPMLVTVGQQVTWMRDEDPFLGGDLVGLALPVAKAAWEVERPGDMGREVARACALARTPPCGPVVLSLPLDVQAAESGAPAPVAAAGAPAPPPPEALDRAAALLRGAARPALIAGDAVAHEGAHAGVAALAERLGAPVWGEPQSAGVALPWDHPLWRGGLPPFAAPLRAALAGHDLVLALGMPVFRLFGSSPGPPLPDGCRLVHVDVDPANIGRALAPEVGIVAHVAPVVAGLHARLGPADTAAAARRAGEVARAAAARRAGRRALAGGGAGADGAVTPAGLCRALAGAIAPRDVVVDEGLTSTRGLRALVSARRPGTWFAHRGSALGWGLPAAVGVALAERERAAAGGGPARRVLCVHGDGSLMWGVHALWTAARERLPLALVVADNGGYEILRAGMEGLTGRPEGDWPGLRVEDPRVDVAGLCRAFGAPVELLDAPRALPAALADLWRRAATGPAVLVVPVAGRTPPVGFPLPVSA